VEEGSAFSDVTLRDSSENYGFLSEAVLELCSVFETHLDQSYSKTYRWNSVLSPQKDPILEIYHVLWSISKLILRSIPLNRRRHETLYL
jgi:hypothetical protein